MHLLQLTSRTLQHEVAPGLEVAPEVLALQGPEQFVERQEYVSGQGVRSPALERVGSGALQRPPVSRPDHVPGHQPQRAL